MIKLGKKARHYAKHLVLNATSMQRFPSLPLVDYAKFGFRQFRAGGNADAMHALMLLLLPLLLAHGDSAELYTLLALPAVSAVDDDFLSKAKGQLAALLTDADAQGAEGTVDLRPPYLLGALGLKAKGAPLVRSLVTVFETKQAEERKKLEDLAAGERKKKEALAASERKKEEDLAVNANAKALAEEEAEVQQMPSH
jgi:hypothetical protein